MMQYQTEAILLAVRNWGEADKMVTLFSREHGKINALAYGVRRPNNRLISGIQPFMHVNLSLGRGRSLDYIKQYDMVNSFRIIREKLELMTYGAFIAELVSEVCPERQSEPLIFDLLVGILKLLSERNPRIVVLAGAWQIIAVTGLLPQLEHCTVCGEKLVVPAYFSVAAGGCICLSCRTSDCFDFSAMARDFLVNLLSLDWHNPGHFTVNGATLIEVEKLLTCFLRYHIDKPLKTLEFIKEVRTVKR